MAEDFGVAWRTVRLYCPTAPTFLVREWVSKAYKDLARSRHWGFLRGELRLTIANSRAITACSVTTGSAIVTSAGLFVAGDAGRQFQTTTFPTYTVQSFQSVNQVTLDIPYGETTNAATKATILDAYATMPTNFESFELIADPYNERRLAFWISWDQLNIMDPTRQASDTGPRCLVQRPPSTYTLTANQVQYEYWPRPTLARSYPAIFNIQPSKLTDTSVFSGVLADAADVIIDGALAQAALWPGTPTVPNAYFNAAIARDKRASFLTGVQTLSLRDDAQHPDDLATVHWERWPLADLAYNDQALRATDATIADLY